MRVLLLEDEESVVAALRRALEQIAEERGAPANVELVHVSHAQDAVAAIRASVFDLAVLDLHVPATSGPSIASTDNGLEVFATLRAHQLGTKTIVFSGHGSGAITRQLMDIVWSADPTGQGQNAQQSMIDFVEKERLEECARRLADYAAHIDALDLVDVDVGETPIELSAEERRVIRIFARRKPARRAKVSLLAGGLSGARTFRLELYRVAPDPVAVAVAKTGDLQDLADEAAAYRQHVAASLDVGVYAPLADHVDAGAGPVGGLFYALATGHERSFLEVLEDSDPDAAAVVTALRTLCAKWTDPRVARDVRVASVRSLFLPDDTFASVAHLLQDIPWQDAERVLISANMCSQHGDLHPLNVLIKEPLEPLLIDFGRTGEAPASSDAVALEMSLVFHPALAALRADWPNHRQAQAWRSLDEYLDGCPRPQFVRACREWAYSVGADREVAAVVYGNAVRQLRWVTDPSLTQRFIVSAIHEIVA
jgi:CheY-like chemotaxis protein